MPEFKIAIEILRHGKGLPIPVHETDQSAGMDLRAAIDANNPVHLKSGARCIIPSGFCMALPPGFEAQIRPRSGLAIKHGVTVLNSPGTVDADYRGEIGVILINLGEKDFLIERGMRIAQMIIAPFTRVKLQDMETIPDSQRGDSGFGSTGNF